MNSAPDRGKECLPPKKREFQALKPAEQRPMDEFKPPPPHMSRALGKPAESKGTLSHPRYGKDPLPPPPKFVPPDPPPFPLPFSFPTTQPNLFISNQMGDKLSPGSSSWRDQSFRMGDSADTSGHYSRWKHKGGAGNPHQDRGHSSYPSALPAESRDFWPFFNVKQRFSSPPYLSHDLHLYQPPLYPREHLPDRRKENGYDGADSRPSHRRLQGGPEPDYYSKMEPESLHGACTNGKRRYLGEQRSLGVSSTKDGCFQEAPSTHSSLQEKEPQLTLKTHPRISTEVKSAKQCPMSTMAQIYYNIPPAYSALAQMPLAYPIYRHSPLAVDRDSEGPRGGKSNSHGSAPSPGAPIDYSSSSPVGSRARAAATTPAASSPSPSYSPGLAPPVVLPHFTKGSLIELSTGELRKVEELQTEDFLRCAVTSPEFHLGYCTVQHISPSQSQGFAHLQVLLGDQNTQELLKVLVEYPFFVCNRGWSSCSPQRTAQLYGLPCHQLAAGDVCLALTPTPTPAPAPPTASPTPSMHHPSQAGGGDFAVPSSRYRDPRTQGSMGSTERTHRVDNMPPPPPPPARQSREQAQGTHRPPKTRKRRWSAPELSGLSSATPDLPHSSKHRKQ
ncbi:ATX1 protein, partial [Amia calva]|nr:ATX1 protein [Amia calva]